MPIRIICRDFHYGKVMQSIDYGKVMQSIDVTAIGAARTYLPAQVDHELTLSFIPNLAQNLHAYRQVQRAAPAGTDEDYELPRLDIATGHRQTLRARGRITQWETSCDSSSLMLCNLRLHLNGPPTFFADDLRETTATPRSALGRWFYEQDKQLRAALRGGKK
jgi:hypothetical protein